MTKKYQKNMIFIFLFLILITWISTANAFENFHNVLIEKESIQNSVFFEIIEPPELKYTYKIKPAKDFGALFNSSFFERRIGLVPAKPLNGCQRAKNSAELRGKVALIQRGECSFLKKTIFAEEVGAKAAIIFDEYPFTMEESRSMSMMWDHFYVEMVKDDKIDETKPVNIPAAFLHGKNGRMILNTLNQLKLSFALINIPVNVTYTIASELHQPPWISW